MLSARLLTRIVRVLADVGELDLQAVFWRKGMRKKKWTENEADEEQEEGEERRRQRQRVREKE